MVHSCGELTGTVLVYIGVVLLRRNLPCVALYLLSRPIVASSPLRRTRTTEEFMVLLLATLAMQVAAAAAVANDASCSTSLAFVRPASSEALRNFLLGTWRLRKAMTYNAGGISGRFDGDATFADVSTDNSLVTFTESGRFTASAGSYSAGMDPVDMRNQLLYDFREPNEVSVFFDEAGTLTTSDSDVDLSQMRFLHTLGIGPTYEISEHSEGEVVYRGELEIETSNAFMLSWQATGPQVDGQIISLFTRDD